MKTCITLFILLIATTAWAQPERTQYAMDGAVHKVGGFSKTEIRYASIDGEGAWIAGFRGVLLLNRGFWLGGAYFMKIDDGVPAAFRAGDRSPYLNLEYGGLNLGYIVATDEIVHVTLDALLGYGEYSFEDPEGIIEFQNLSFLILEPGANIEINIFEWMRLNFGASLRVMIGNEENNDVIQYQFGRQVHEYDFESSDLSGVSINFGLTFGGF
ncbi:MAG: hypothetical protein CL946_09495 [Ectothiorhodospiraceae bacterium]|nr:hypothetical protein [Ectothiorhodospiraceae bacterium]